MSRSLPSEVELPRKKYQKILIQDSNGRREALTDRSAWEASRFKGNDSSPEVLISGENEWETLRISSLKSVSFVESFDAQEHERLQFYDGTIPKEKLWVRLRLQEEEEWLEGFMHNSESMFAGDLASLQILDPWDRETLILFPRSRIEQFQVLGLR